MATIKELFTSVLVALTVLSAVNSYDDVLVPSTENDFETQHSMVLPMTLKCPYVRHKFIEIRGVILLNGSDVIIASSLAPNMEDLTSTECLASLVQSDDKPASCDVSLQALPQDGSVDQMEKVVTFDCKKSLGNPSAVEKTVSKKKGTINIKCDNKQAVPEIINIKLANGGRVNKVSVNWKCSEENVRNINNGNGGHCHIKTKDYTSDSEMTVKYRCSDPPKREIEEFVRGNGKKGGGNRGNGNGKNSRK